jgi:hypothetical protein
MARGVYLIGSKLAEHVTAVQIVDRAGTPPRCSRKTIFRAIFGWNTKSYLGKMMWR